MPSTLLPPIPASLPSPHPPPPHPPPSPIPSTLASPTVSLVAFRSSITSFSRPDDGRFSVLVDCSSASLWSLRPAGSLLKQTVSLLHSHFPHHLARMHVLHLHPAVRLLATAVLKVSGLRVLCCEGCGLTLLHGKVLS